MQKYEKVRSCSIKKKLSVIRIIKNFYDTDEICVEVDEPQNKNKIIKFEYIPRRLDWILDFYSRISDIIF